MSKNEGQIINWAIRSIAILALIQVLFISSHRELIAQDFQFSQYYAAPLYLNPAFTGTAEVHRLNFNARMQWPNLPRAYQTLAFSYDYNLARLNSGFGILFTRDRAGSGNLGNTSPSFLYAYKASINQRFVISVGSQFSYNFVGINRNGLTLGDQLASDRPVSFDSELDNIRNFSYFDFSMGALAYSERIWAGIAMHHLTQPNVSFIGDNDPLQLKLSIHAGIRIPLYQGPKEFEQISSIAPSFIYKRQGVNDQIDVGINWHYDPISAGLWYRGIPFQRSEVNSLYDRDAMVFMFGLKFPDFEFAYSYDFTISNLGGNAGGAHEISIVYNFYQRAKKKRKEKFLPCPSF